MPLTAERREKLLSPLQMEFPFGNPRPISIPEKTTLRTDEVAKALGCSDEHVRHLIQDGSLEAIDIRTKGAQRPALRLRQTSVLDFLRNRRAQ